MDSSIVSVPILKVKLSEPSRLIRGASDEIVTSSRTVSSPSASAIVSNLNVDAVSTTSSPSAVSPSPSKSSLTFVSPSDAVNSSLKPVVIVVSRFEPLFPWLSLQRPPTML